MRSDRTDRKDRTDRTDKAIRQLVHDMKNPLTAANLQLRIVEQALDDPQMRKRITWALQELEEIQTLLVAFQEERQAGSKRE